MSIKLRVNGPAFDALTGAHYHPVTYYADAGKFARMPLGWILHVTVGNGNPHDMFQNAPKGSRKFSHGWVAKDGTFERYGALNTESWAQVDGNSDYWSFETEGFPSEKLTDAQIRTLARIHHVLKLASGRDLDHVINRPGQVGIGTHSMGGPAWGGHACPGDIRAAQRADIITLSRRLTLR